MRRRLPPPSIQAHEDERYRIAQELREGLRQMLFAVKVKTALVQSLDDPARRSVVLSELQAIVDKTMEQGRTLACELSAWSLTEPGQPRSLDGVAESRALLGRCRDIPREPHEIGSLPAAHALGPVAHRSHLLSGREREVLRLLTSGLSTRQIGQVLHVGTGTIAGYRQSIAKKLGLRGVARLTKYAVAVGLTSLES